MILLHVITSIPRPSKEIIEHFKNIPVATVYKESGKKGFIDSRIKP